jgi:hypothetical protein
MNQSYSKGISWINDCRIPFVDDIDLEEKQNQHSINGKIYGGGKGFHSKPITLQMFNSQGRFPANILVSDDMLNDGIISKSNNHKWEGEDTSPIYGKYENRTRTQVYSDKGSNSRYYNIDKWFEKLLDV